MTKDELYAKVYGKRISTTTTRDGYPLNIHESATGDRTYINYANVGTYVRFFHLTGNYQITSSFMNHRMRGTEDEALAELDHMRAQVVKAHQWLDDLRKHIHTQQKEN